MVPVEVVPPGRVKPPVEFGRPGNAGAEQAEGDALLLISPCLQNLGLGLRIGRQKIIRIPDVPVDVQYFRNIILHDFQGKLDIRLAAVGIERNEAAIVARSQLMGVDRDVDIVGLTGHDAFPGEEGDAGGMQPHDVAPVNPDPLDGDRGIPVHQRQSVGRIRQPLGHRDFDAFRLLREGILLEEELVVQENGQLPLVRAFPDINGDAGSREAVT